MRSAMKEEEEEKKATIERLTINLNWLGSNAHRCSQVAVLDGGGSDGGGNGGDDAFSKTGSNVHAHAGEHHSMNRLLCFVCLFVCWWCVIVVGAIKLDSNQIKATMNGQANYVCLQRQLSRKV